jgi:two-component system copper resistance phosphate regulon response regulator CusR
MVSAFTGRLGEKKMRILIIEDEEKTANYLRKGLMENTFAVDVSDNGVEGLRLAESNDYSVIILDVMLPGMDGWEVLRALRGKGKTTPVLFLTAKDAVPDRVKGLELGADDYLVKPFAYSELLARIHTLMRRGPVLRPNVLRVADLELDFQALRASRAGKRLDLTPKEFALLALLMQRGGEVLTRTRIAERIWNVDFESDANVVDVHMRRLRIKVDEPFEKKLIQTVRGVGYVLEER